MFRAISIARYFLVNDMLIAELPPLIVAKLGFWSKKMRNVLNPMKNQFSEFYFFEKWLILYSNSSKIRTDFCKPDSETLTNVTR